MEVMLKTDPVVKHPADPVVCVPAGQLVGFSKLAAVALTIPTPLRSGSELTLRSAMKNASCAGSATAMGVPTGANTLPLALMLGKPPSRSAAQFSVERCRQKTSGEPDKPRWSVAVASTKSRPAPAPLGRKATDRAACVTALGRGSKLKIFPFAEVQGELPAALGLAATCRVKRNRRMAR